MSRTIVLLCLSLLLAWSHVGQAGEAGVRLDAGSIESEHTGWTYPLSVYLPASYAESSQSYPVLYALDAKIRFDLIADRLDELAAEVIVIGIYTTGDTRREIDFVMPGATTYARFLTEELVPWVDQTYRSDPTDRTLAGHSLAGLLSSLVLILEDPRDRQFNAYLVSDGSFWDQPDKTEQLVQTLRTNTDTLPVTVFMTGATNGNIRGVRFFRSLLVDSNFKELSITYEVYETNHRGVIKPSFYDGLEFLFAN